jgi:hypothetical protein
MRLTLGTERIHDEHSFHIECQRALGFPGFYGENMNAWIDCMSSLRSGDGMVSVQLGSGELLELEIPDVEALRQRAPDIVDELVNCTAIVNKRFEAWGQAPAITLLFT